MLVRRPLLLASALLLPLACSGDDGGDAAGGGGGEQSPEAFCAVYAAINDSELSTSDSDDPAVLGPLIEGARAQFDALRNAAPDDIRDAAAELASAYGTFADFSAAIQYD